MWKQFKKLFKKQPVLTRYDVKNILKQELKNTAFGPTAIFQSGASLIEPVFSQTFIDMLKKEMQK